MDHVSKPKQDSVDERKTNNAHTVFALLASLTRQASLKHEVFGIETEKPIFPSAK